MDKKMIFANIRVLPKPPNGKTGWPWTEGSNPISEKIIDGTTWPKISIVTPSYNQGQYIEETIRSVLLQGYPNLEYIIMDGGSTDNSVEIIKKYEPWLKYWVSEKDKGQSDAIKRGFKITTGDILAYINSDDFYLKNALHTIAKIFLKHNEVSLIIGSSIHIDSKRANVKKYYGYPVTHDSLLFLRQHFSQPSAFWPRKLYFDCGEIDDSFYFCFDYDLFLKLTKVKSANYTSMFLSVFRRHDNAKSVKDIPICLEEGKTIRGKYNTSSDDIHNIKKHAEHYEYYEKIGLLRNVLIYPSDIMRVIKNKIKEITL